MHVSIFPHLDICTNYFCYCSFRKCSNAAVFVICCIILLFHSNILLDLIYIFRCKWSVKLVQCGWYAVILSRLNISKLTLSDSYKPSRICSDKRRNVVSSHTNSKYYACFSSHLDSSNWKCFLLSRVSIDTISYKTEYCQKEMVP